MQNQPRDSFPSDTKKNPKDCMTIWLCNAPATFQRCMMSIFYDFIEEVMEIFMDDFLVYGPSFENCLENLETVL